MTTRAAEQGAVRDDAPVANDFGLVVRPINTSPIEVLPTPSTTAGPVAVGANLAPVVLLAANALRVGFSIRNSSAADTLYVLAGGGVVSAVLHTVALVPGAYYEDPYNYVGAVTGIWGPAATGDALVTEYTPAP